MLDNVLEESRRNKRRKIKRGIYLLPNLLTSASLFGGFYSIVACLDGNFKLAAAAIFVSAVFDCLDGRIARLTGTSSKFGVEYDSLSDLVAFGLAPGVLIFTWGLRPFGRYGWLAAFLYVVCGALRLARFNVQITTVESNRFKGLPVPAAAMLVASTVLLFTYLGQSETTKHITILILVYCLAFLMVSNVRYYSFKELNLSRRMPFRLLVGLIFLFVVIAAEPHVMLFVLTLGYVASGPVTMYLDNRERIERRFARWRREVWLPGRRGSGGGDLP
ncbi:MAG TPA: CDP-diacylglycerol--serine O-phosphatidyltransferase [Deltaproteobacteria bacterium]|nr:CDP-diacylglycerol--serine O-phosphatidyltransferase [Deltaproteobacteria bacterium]